MTKTGFAQICVFIIDPLLKAMVKIQLDVENVCVCLIYIIDALYSGVFRCEGMKANISG